MPSIRRTTKHWRKRLRKTTEGRKISPVIMDWQNQHSKNGYTAKSNLHVQCNSHQNPNDIHHSDWKIYPKVHLETQKTMNSQENTGQEEQPWRHHNTWLQTVLHSHSNKSTMALAQKQTWRPAEQNRGPRYESTQLYSPYFWQRSQKYTMEKRHPLQQMLLGKVVICLQNTDPCLSPCTGNQLKVD
jgi:hypothetical protein